MVVVLPHESTHTTVHDPPNAVRSIVWQLNGTQEDGFDVSVFVGKIYKRVRVGVGVTVGVSVRVEVSVSV